MHRGPVAHRLGRHEVLTTTSAAGLTDGARTSRDPNNHERITMQGNADDNDNTSSTALRGR